MKVDKIDHLCVAVKDLDRARRVWEPLLGKSGPDDQYIHDPEQIRVARYWIGEVGFELMESTTPDGPVSRWIGKHGEGVMLVSFHVPNTSEAVAELGHLGYPFIPDGNGEITRPFRDGEFALIHPGKLSGVLTELID